MQVPFSPPDIGELEIQYVTEVLRSGWITTGPKTKELEKKLAVYLEKERVACLNSATAAMELSLRIMGIGPGDEVITSAYTYTASASVIDHVGAKIVLVDCLPDSVLIDPEAVRNAITDKTKAVIPVDIAGIPADYNSIYKAIEDRKELFCPANEIQKELGRVAIIADCAHSLGARYHGRPVAVSADIACFSFHAVKNFTTAEGGAMTWKLPFGNEQVPTDVDYMPTVPKKEGETWNELLYRLCQLFSLHGQNKDALAKTKLGAWEYDIIGPWYKCNMTDIMAALGLVQMERYNGILERRYEIVRRYDEALKDLPVAVLNHKDANHCGSHHLYLVRLLGKSREDANKVIEQMAERGIACNVHYKPLPMMTAYKALGFDIKNYPNAYHLFENEVSLPLHTKLSDEDIEYVTSNFVDIVKSL